MRGTDFRDSNTRGQTICLRCLPMWLVRRYLYQGRWQYNVRPWDCVPQITWQSEDVIMLVECILEGADSFSHLIIVLDARASHSRTTKLWSDNLVKTVIIMMIFSRAGHEDDWALHLYAEEAMLPYFCAAGCHNYARYEPKPKCSSYEQYYTEYSSYSP